MTLYDGGGGGCDHVPAPFPFLFPFPVHVHGHGRIHSHNPGPGQGDGGVQTFSWRGVVVVAVVVPARILRVCGGGDGGGLRSKLGELISALKAQKKIIIK